MSMPEMSFQFGPYNSLTDLGIICEVYDPLLPPKRERKIEIPGLDGMYDFGANSYDERVIECECKLINQISKSQLREVAYKLSGKQRLSFWDEPEKYYTAELYDSPSIQNIADRLWLEFSLTFVCEPFAYSELKNAPLYVGNNPIEYQGTAKTPTIITLHNHNNFSVSNIQLTVIRRRG